MLVNVKVFKGSTSEINLEACNIFKKKIKKKLINHKSHSNMGNIIHVVTYH